MIITSLSSTGSGKTTLMTHLAYLIAQAGHSVALIELDNRNSFKDCCGLDEPTPEQSTAAILADGFCGKYPLIPLWKDVLKGKAQVCQAHRDSLDSVSRQLTGDPFGIFRFQERLQEYPLPHDVILIDAPGQQGQLSVMALCAATHLIICAEMTQKCISDISALFEWLYRHSRKHQAQVIGIVPGRYEHSYSIQRNTLSQFPELAQQLGTQCFSPIRQSPRFLNAYANGITIFAEAPGTPAAKDFTEPGNLFKGMSEAKLKGLNAKVLKQLPAIASFVMEMIEENRRG